MKRLFSVTIVSFVVLGFAIIMVDNLGLSQNGTYTCGLIQENYIAPSVPDEGMRFAVIGDYGTGNQDEASVSTLIHSWNPAFIVTLGDNNYPHGDPSDLDGDVGQFFQDYIGSYQGDFGSGSAENRFFPVLGNHDWMPGSISGYLSYFSLDTDQRYYTFIQGNVQFFMLDSDPHEPDGISVDSVQAAWLHQQLAASTAAFKVVAMHHPPYSSGQHGSTDALQWPFQEWGASVVLSGHEHSYERIIHEDFTYIVNGLGGAQRYPFYTPLTGSITRYDCGFGAMLVDVTESSMVFRFVTTQNELVDIYTITANPLVN